jgi:Ca2+-binding RTX toxin-like protein
MSTSTLISSDQSLEQILAAAVAHAQQQLTELALRDGFFDQMQLAFGNEFDREILGALRQQWASGNFEGFPEIEVRAGAELKGANGAFAAATNTIYVSRDYLERNGSNLPAVTNVLLEEFGHFVDAQINKVDVVGDEGALFAAVVKSENLSNEQIDWLRKEEDSAVITADTKPIQAEAQTSQNSMVVPLLHPIYEDIAKLWVYERENPSKQAGSKPLHENQIISLENFNGEIYEYKVDKIFRDLRDLSTIPEWDTGFFAIGLVPVSAQLQSPILAIRGTEANSPADIYADTDPRGVGYNQFKANYDIEGKDDIKDWLDQFISKNKLPDLVGHSLGGALAQTVAANYTYEGGSIGELVTFNSPAIDDEIANLFKSEKSNSVTHYIVSGDLFSLAGEEFLPGNVYLLSYPSAGFSSLVPILDKHTRTGLLEALIDSEFGNQPEFPVTASKLSISELNSPSFGYDDPDYNRFLSGVSLVPKIEVPSLGSVQFAEILNQRGTVEQVRKSGGQETREVLQDVTSPEFWQAQKINWINVQNQLDGVLRRIQSTINSEIYGAEGLKNIGSLEGLPFFGDSLEAVKGSQFIEEWSNKIKERFNEKFLGITEVSPQEMQQALYEIFGSSSLRMLKDSDDLGNEITKDDIKVVQTGSLVTYDFDLGGTKIFDIDLPTDLGLPQVGLEYRNPETGEAPQPKASADLDFTFDFGFGIDSVNNDFFFNVSPEKDLSLLLKPSVPQAEAKFGFLVGDAKDIGSQIQFTIDLGDGNDNQLRLNELSNLIVDPEGAADIKLNFVSKTNFSNVQQPTQLGTDLNIHWDFIEGALQPSVKLENISLELGSFLADFLAPTIDPIQKVTSPIGKVYDLLTDTKVTILPGDPTLLNLAKDIPSPLLQVGLFGVDLIGQVDDLLDTISDSANQLTNLTLDLGDINLGSFDLRDLFASTEKAQTIALSSKSLTELKNDIPSGSQYESYRKFFDLILSDQTGGIFSLPILQGGEAISKILLGQAYENLGLNQRVELFSINLEDLNFQISTADDRKFDLNDLGIPIPDFGLDGTIGFTLNFKAAYDSYGLQQWAENDSFDPQKISVIADGLILDDHREGGTDKPEIILSAGISGGASIPTPPVLPLPYLFGTAKADASISGSISIDLEDLGEAGSNLGDSDGILRGSEVLRIAAFDPKALIDFRGQIKASLRGSYTNTIPIPFFDDVVTNVIPAIRKSTTLDLQKLGLLPSPKKVPVLADNGPNNFGGGLLELNIGARANNRLFINTSDQAETFSIIGTGNSGKDTITVTAFGNSQIYSNVTKITADAGKFNDFIGVEKIAIPVEFYGGDGRDKLFGGNADDILSPGRGADVLDGQGGNDTVCYADAARGALVDLADEEGNIGEFRVFGILQEGLPIPRYTSVFEDEFSSFKSIFSKRALSDELKNIENIVGSPFADNLAGDTRDNKLEGGEGDDSLAGRRGADVLDGGSGIDTVDYGDEERAVFVNLEQEIGDIGELQVLALPTFPTFPVLPPIPIIRRIFEDELPGLQLPPFYKIFSQTPLLDQLQDIENVVGSDFDDTLIGNIVNNKIEGGKGNDTLAGGLGADFLDGGIGTDTVSYIDSERGVNVELEVQQASIGEVEITLKPPFSELLPTVKLRVFEDEISGSAMALADQLLVKTPLTSPLRQQVESLIGEGAVALVKHLLDVTPLIDTLKGFENVIGSSFSDVIRGNNDDNSLTGGTGDDTFVLSPAKGTDTVTDFTIGEDRIQLTGGLTYEQLNIAQGSGENANDTLIWVKENNELLAILKNVNASDLPPGTLTVDTLTDEVDGSITDGDVSLRDAISFLAEGGIIDFAPGLSGTIELDPGLGAVIIDKSLTLDGSGTDLITISADNQSRVIVVEKGNFATPSDVLIRGLTITEGRGGIENRGTLSVESSIITNNLASEGGGIENFGKLKLFDSIISSNEADEDAGGVLNYGTLEVVNSAIFGNTAGDQGGGLYHVGDWIAVYNSTVSGNQADGAAGILNGGGSRAEIINSTIYNNSSSNDSGGIRNVGVMEIGNTIVAGNTAVNEGPDVTGAYESLGFNLIGVKDGSTGFNDEDIVGTLTNPIDPKLEPLTNNGGFTPTHALQADSPAVDRGRDTVASRMNLQVDQRGTGFQRSYDADGLISIYGDVDIGAFELQSIRLEVADMQLANYKVENASFASSGTLIALADSQSPQLNSSETEGTAKTTFDGPAGLYKVQITYFDESDGQGRAIFEVGSTHQREDWFFDQDLPGTRASQANRLTITLEQTFLIQSGDVISLTGIKDPFSEGYGKQRERMRFDDIKFIPVGLIGGESDNQLTGNNASNTLAGLGSNDTLYGEAGDNQIWDNDDDGLLRGDLGNDTLIGDDFSDGSDTFVLAIGEGTDTITDFEMGTDLIGPADGLTFGQLTISEEGGNTLLSIGNETLASLNSVDPPLLTEASFTLV